MSTPPAIVLRSVRRSFPEGRQLRHVLNGLSAEIPFGQISMIVGPSGCGKTTLLTVLAGLLLPTSGELEILGSNLSKLSENELTRFRREHFGFVFQDCQLIPALNVVENVSLPLLAAGSSRRAALVRATEALAEVQMQGREQTQPSRLSGGEKQRVAIARALISNPRLIFCDEPTAALDHQTGETVMSLLQKAAEVRGAGVLVVTHDPRVLSHAGLVLKMDDGQFVNS